MREGLNPQPPLAFALDVYCLVLKGNLKTRLSAQVADLMKRVRFRAGAGWVWHLSGGR